MLLPNDVKLQSYFYIHYTTTYAIRLFLHTNSRWWLPRMGIIVFAAAASLGEPVICTISNFVFSIDIRPIVRPTTTEKMNRLWSGMWYIIRPSTLHLPAPRAPQRIQTHTPRRLNIKLSFSASIFAIKMYDDTGKLFHTHIISILLYIYIPTAK